MLICHAFADVEHTGSFRWRSLSRHLAARGWQFDVIAASDDRSPDRAAGEPDRQPSTMERAVELRVHGVSTDSLVARWRARRLARYRTREQALATEANRFEALEPVAPENVTRVTPGQPLEPVEHLTAMANSTLDEVEASVWQARALRLGRRLLTEGGPFELIIATSPEVVTHRVGERLARESGLPLVLDYRDPIYFGRGTDRARLDRLQRWRWRRAELRSLAEAAAIVDIASGAGESSITELQQTSPTLARRRRVVIPSGYDPMDTAAVDARCFRIVYTGWLWPFMPLPELLSAVAQFRDSLSGASAKEAISLELLGVNQRFNGVPIMAIARYLGLEAHIEILPRLPREEASRRQQRAAVLLAFDSVCARAICIPSKLYHYAQCRGRLLPIGDPNGSMAAEAGKIGVETIAPDDGSGLQAAFRAAHDDWANHRLTEPSDRHGVLDFRHRADEMAALLDATRQDRDKVNALAESDASRTDARP